MKIVITESQYVKLYEDVNSNKDCKIWVDSKDDPKYKRYLIEYKVYMEGYKFAKSLNFPQVTNLSDYDYFSTDFVEAQPWFKYDECYKEYFNYEPSSRNNEHKKVKQIVQDNIRKFGIKPKSLGYKDIRFPAYLKPAKVCVRPPKPVVQPTPTPPKPIEEPKKDVVTKVTPTEFSVTWREDSPSGKVEQNTHYFPNYEEWKKFTDQFDKYINKNENNNKTSAEALYSGKLNLSKDKTY